MLPREEREERAIGKFLKYHNQTNNTSYRLVKWLDRVPHHKSEQPGPIPDCLCKDENSGKQLIIERTMLTGEQDLELVKGAEQFLCDVSTQLKDKLPGVFNLDDWGVNAIHYTANNRQQKIDQLCQQILDTAPTLTEGEMTCLSDPFPVKLIKLAKEDADRLVTKSVLLYTIPACAYAKDRQILSKQLEDVLIGADKKFQRYTKIPTVLLLNIFEIGLDYGYFKAEVFSKVNMGNYPNIMHIYLSEGQADPPIYSLWTSYDDC